MKSYIEFLKNRNINTFPTELISEGLIKSIDYDVMISKLHNIFDINSDIFIMNDSLGIDLCIPKKYFNKQIFNNFKNLLSISGYIVSYFILDKKEQIIRNISEYDIFQTEYKNIQIHLIKKFDINSDGIPEKLYHVTKRKYLNKILKNGLIPKSENKIEKHPDRIYVLDSLNGAKDFKSILVNIYGDEDYIILEIETKLLNHIKLYYDPTYFQDEEDSNKHKYSAYYTYDNISPLSISII